jgi:hypothetical protein
MAKMVIEVCQNNVSAHGALTGFKPTFCARFTLQVRGMSANDPLLDKSYTKQSGGANRHLCVGALADRAAGVSCSG